MSASSAAARSFGRGSETVRSLGVSAGAERVDEAWVRVAWEMEHSVSATRARPGGVLAAVVSGRVRA